MILLVNPRKICERMTPEFPLAPRSEPLEMALHRDSISIPSPSAATSFAADMMVMVILVPVSPSGTGKTFSSLIHSFLFSRFFAPAKNILESILASICRTLTPTSSLINHSDTIYIDVYLFNFNSCKFFNLILYIADQIIRYSQYADTISNNDMKIKH